MARITNKANQEALTTVLKSVGIDADPFFKLSQKTLELANRGKGIEKSAAEESKALSAVEKSRISEIEKSGKSHADAIEQAAEERQKAAKTKGNAAIEEGNKFGDRVVPGKTTEELAGKGNVRVLNSNAPSTNLANAVRQAAQRNPYAMFQIVYGVARHTATSPLW